MRSPPNGKRSVLDAARLTSAKASRSGAPAAARTTMQQAASLPASVRRRRALAVRSAARTLHPHGRGARPAAASGGCRGRPSAPRRSDNARSGSQRHRAAAPLSRCQATGETDPPCCLTAQCYRGLAASSSGTWIQSVPRVTRRWATRSVVHGPFSFDHSFNFVCRARSAWPPHSAAVSRGGDPLISTSCRH